MKILRELNPTRVWLSRIVGTIREAKKHKKSIIMIWKTNNRVQCFGIQLLENFSVNSKSEVTNDVEDD